MKEEILKFLAEGNTKSAAMTKFGISGYRLNKILKEAEEESFFDKVVSEDAELTMWRMDRMYYAYCGFAREKGKTPGSVRAFATEMLRRSGGELPSDSYFTQCKAKIQLGVQVRCGCSSKVLDYYEGLVSANDLRQLKFTGYDADCVGMLIGDLSVSDFVKKWGSLRGIYDAEFEVKEREFNDATCYVEQAMVERKFPSLKSLRKFFNVEYACTPVVEVVLCDKRHNVEGVVGAMDAKPIFQPLQNWQMDDANWMMSKVNAWIDANIRFDGDKAMQSMCVYTTGYNPLNMSVVKCALQRKVNLTVKYFNPNKNSYWEQAIITQFEKCEQKLPEYLADGKYYVFGDVKGDELYRCEVKLEDEGVVYQFVSTDADVMQMIKNNLSYQFVKHPFSARIYLQNANECKKLFEVFLAGEDFS